MCLCPSIIALFPRQSFLKPKCLYTRLPFIQYKSVIFTADFFYASGMNTLVVPKAKTKQIKKKTSRIVCFKVKS